MPPGIRNLFACALLAAGIPGQGYDVHVLNAPAGAPAFGAGVAVLGDLDGNGAREFAVGAPGATEGGAVFVHSGSDGSRLFAMRSSQGGFFQAPEDFGAALAAGPAPFGTTLAIGDPLAGEPSPFNSDDDPGAVYLARLTPRRVVDGTVAAGSFGAAVACVGDVDGDGALDILAGAPDAAGGLVHGRASLVSGRTGLVIRSHATTSITNERFGGAVAGVGDVTGDGVPDYAIADPGADVLLAGADAGQVRVYNGATGAQILILNGTQGGERFGSSLLGLGPAIAAPNPGESGLVVGSPGATIGGAAACGKISVIGLPSGTVAATFGGGALGGAQARFGTALAETSSATLFVGTPGAGVGPLGGVGRVVELNFTTGAIVRVFNNPGTGAQDGFGSSIVHGGDFVTPGIHRDLAVGAPGAGAADEGAVHLFDANGNHVRTRAGTSPSARLGSALALAGDVDGDGRHDVVAGGPGSGGGTIVVFSSASGSFLSVALTVGDELLGAALATLRAPAQPFTHRYGWVAGSPGADLPGLTDAGRIEITAGADLRLANASGADLAHLGASVAVLGDLDGDGAPDIATGAPGFGSGGLAGRGLAVVLDGAGLGTLFQVLGTAAGDALGTSVAAAGDVNGDAVPDLAAGIPGADGALSFQANAGRVSWFSGTSGALIRSVLGTATNEASGRSLAPLGDVNGDGVTDLAAGSPAFSPVLLNGAGRVRLLSGANATALRAINGTVAGDAFGASVAGAGDQDGDGVPDVLVGVPFSNGAAGPADRGAVRVHSGATGALVLALAGPPVAGAHFGSALAAGEITGDCVSDFLAGAPESGLGHARVQTRFGLGAGAFRFGTPCPGSGGFAPVISTFGGNPSTLGNPAFGLAATCAVGGAPAWLILGVSSSTWNGFALPLDLGIVGLGGCSLRVSAELIVPGAAGGTGPGQGLALYPIPLPADPSLNNLTVFAQVLLADAGSPNGGGAMTSGLAVTLTAGIP